MKVRSPSFWGIATALIKCCACRYCRRWTTARTARALHRSLRIISMQLYRFPQGRPYVFERQGMERSDWKRRVWTGFSCDTRTKQGESSSLLVLELGLTFLLATRSSSYATSGTHQLGHHARTDRHESLGTIRSGRRDGRMRSECRSRWRSQRSPRRRSCQSRDGGSDVLQRARS